ncbi:MAG: hypothetical protein BroJett029_21020 [Alphaproteobacteria bacterium]|nr:MAG: hypothetical protein BroJett029_21020 [Alphaproteobacteria bacterium]
MFITVALAGISVTIYARLDDWRPRAAMIGALLGWFVAPIGCAALRYGASNALKPQRKPMKSNAGGWRPQLAALALVTSLLGACARVGSEPKAAAGCPPVVEYGQEFQAGGSRQTSAVAGGLGDRRDAEQLFCDERARAASHNGNRPDPAS